MKTNRFGSLVLLEYPEKYRCPICNSPLFFTYSEKQKIFFVTCENYNSCYSPWRKMPNSIPWHIHFNPTDEIEIGPQFKHPAHINKEAEELKCRQAEEILNRIKNEDQKLFEKMLVFYFEYFIIPQMKPEDIEEFLSKKHS